MKEEIKQENPDIADGDPGDGPTSLAELVQKRPRGRPSIGKPVTIRLAGANFEVAKALGRHGRDKSVLAAGIRNALLVAGALGPEKCKELLDGIVSSEPAT